jgi:hypothetical protein
VNAFVSSYLWTLADALDGEIARMACVARRVRGEQTPSFPSLDLDPR